MLTLDRDQELRFTVHDSPDYYQLKVSVFNDDRKTELIGETWASLEQIIVPGGGKQDHWHHLNCKGKFAGEIRIELTYYDTRPKESKSGEYRQSSTVSGAQDLPRESSSSVGGPRQSKPIKRRPLPSDPTIPDSSRSSPQPFTPPPATPHAITPQEEARVPSFDPRTEVASPADNRHHNIDQDHYRNPLSTANGYDVLNSVQPNQDDYSEPFHENGYGRMSGPSAGWDNQMQDLQQYTTQTNAPVYGEYDNAAPPQDQQNYPTKGYSPNAQFDGRYDSLSEQPMQDAYNNQRSSFSSSLPQHTSMPEFGTRQIQQPQGSPLPRRGDYSLDEGYNAYSPSALLLEDEAPPPPPVHRSSTVQSSPSSAKAPADSYPPVSGPPPLNIRHARGSISASPLSQVHNSVPHSDYDPSGSPTTLRKQPHPYSSRSSHHSYTSPERRQSPERFPVSPSREYSQPTPPSLVPGYDPRVAEDESDRFVREQHPIVRQASEPVPQYQAYATQRTPNTTQPTPRNDVPLQLRMLGNGQDTRPHRASAPIVPRREVSPGIRTPIRKSVSPQPGPAPGERRRSAVPFGPDSYDAFNPALNDAASINSAGPKYNTPEQAREAQYEREREDKLAEGPIIGSDGREIDPSDHLPTETWAPEPESKTPKKKPEVTVRFRRSPAGAQPMPTTARRATESSGRPGPMVTPAYAHSSDAISPASAAQSRLQKKSRVTIAQPVSSPAVPTVNTNIRAGMPRAASDHPLREHQNHDYNSSLTFGGPSPRSHPPPVPGKVPLNANTGQEDWGMSALSEEMRMIDIGVGPGSGRARRNRYGMSEAGRY